MRAMWFVRFPWDPVFASQAQRLYRSEDGNEGCAYFVQPERPGALPRGATASRLQLLLELDGRAAGSPADWHYIVATDVASGHEGDFNAWYEREHLPGLAAVPGTARAARYLATQGEGPRYHACYDLADRAAFGSPAWLAVRATPWSSRVRPFFRNTLRTMYRRVR